MEPSGQRRWRWVGRAVVAAVAGLAVAGAVGSAHASAGLAVLVLGLGEERSLRGLVAAIAVGAVVVGAIGWAVAGLVSNAMATGLATGLGIAVGGGLGSVVWLLAVGGEAAEDTESVTVDMAETDEEGAGPEPADLFEASPDPILYYAADDQGAVVRAANPAYGEVFGVEPAELEGRDLAEALRIEAAEHDLGEAAASGRAADERVAVAAADGAREFRVRVAPTGGAAIVTGYVIYGPAE